MSYEQIYEMAALAEFAYLAAQEAPLIQNLRISNPGGEEPLSFEPVFEEHVIRSLIEGELTALSLVGTSGSGKGMLAHNIAIAAQRHPYLKKELRGQGRTLEVVTAPYAHSAQVLRKIEPRFRGFKIGIGSQRMFARSTAFWNENVQHAILDKPDPSKSVLLVAEFPFLMGYPIPHIRPLQVLGMDRGIGSVDLLEHHERSRDRHRVIFLDREEDVLDHTISDRGNNGNPDEQSRIELIYTDPISKKDTPFRNLKPKAQRELTDLRKISQTPIERIPASDEQVRRIKEQLLEMTYEEYPGNAHPILEGPTNRDLTFAITRSLGVPDYKIITPQNPVMLDEMNWYFSYLLQMNMWTMRYPQQLLGTWLQGRFAKHIAKSPYRLD